MECPKCGFVLIDNRWICENCGAEIKIVPDFELELENSINEVLLNVAEEINPARNNEAVNKQEEEIHEIKHKSGLDIKKKKFKRWLYILAGVIVFSLMTVLISLNAYRNNSVSYHINLAANFAANGDYKNAAVSMARADSIKANDAEIRLTWAAYCYANQDYDQAAGILLEMINSLSYSWAEKDKCYERIISIWDERGRYQEISDLLTKSRDDSIIGQYLHYLPAKPIFSQEAGDYTGSLLLSLQSDSQGTIYYTLDGTEPTRESNVYTKPLYLGAGEYEVSAVFENRYGILSSIATSVYNIDLILPEPPIIKLTDGRYILPTAIVVEVPEGCEVYYTTDDSYPNLDSEHYREPFYMLFGSNVYQFVAINEEGFFSEVVTREFDFRLNSDITLEMAVESVLKAHLRRGRIADMSGKAVFEPGYFEYIFTSLIDIENKGFYYMIEEYYYEDGGELLKTGHIFAADAYTGEAAHLIYNVYGNLDAVLL